MPLIVKGARQIGKTESIRNFGVNNYKNVVEINFILNKEFKVIFDESFNVDVIIKNITLLHPELEFIPNETLIFFDEIQDCINCATSLKSFREDGRFDVICSGSLMGINYNEIESNSVGNKLDYTMYSLDFEEFLWAKGYNDSQIKDMYEHMVNLTPFTELEMNLYNDIFKEYMVIGGMPAIVSRFVSSNNYSGTLEMQRQILLDYEEDITKYAIGLDKAKVLNIYRKIPVFLGKDNKKFQISKVENGALYENAIADALVKQKYDLYFYKNEKGTLEEDFFVRDSDSLIPVEVKATDGATASLNKLIESKTLEDIKFGIKLCSKNIGFNGKFYTFPYFLTFILKRFLKEYSEKNINIDER